MVLIILIFSIFFYSLNVFNQNLTSSLVRRLCAISLLSAGVLIINTFYIQLIGSGTGMYSGLLEVSLLSNIISLFILIISSILFLIWPNLGQLKIFLREQLSNRNLPVLEIKETYNFNIY